MVFRVLRARNGAGGFIGQLGQARGGVVGFNNSLQEASSGAGGFMWTARMCRRVLEHFEFEKLPGRARKSSPCGAVSARTREKVRPAGLKRRNFGLFGRVGRVFSRKSRWKGRAGRVFSRQPTLRPVSSVACALHARSGGGGLHYTKPSHSVSPECRTLM